MCYSRTAYTVKKHVHRLFCFYFDSVLHLLCVEFPMLTEIAKKVVVTRIMLQHTDVWLCSCCILTKEFVCYPIFCISPYLKPRIFFLIPRNVSIPLSPFKMCSKDQ